MTPVTAAGRATNSISAYGPARTTVAGTPLNAEDLRKIHAYWRACNYFRGLNAGLGWKLMGICCVLNRPKGTRNARALQSS
jgi:hypothetical protein